MKCAIVASKKDIAGMNIRSALLRIGSFSHAESSREKAEQLEGDFADMLTIAEETVEADWLDELGYKLIIFATRHQGASGKPTLSVHTPGNFSTADYGGKPGFLCNALPMLMKEALLLLDKNADEIGYTSTLESTHHGPSIDTPCMFIEIGSTERQWNDRKAADLLADTIMRLVKGLDQEPKNLRVAVGIGGNHYCANFNRIMRIPDYSISHICPKYALENLDAKMLDMMRSRSVPEADLLILDWKGLGSEKQRLLSLIEGSGLDYLRTKDIKD